MPAGPVFVQIQSLGPHVALLKEQCHKQEIEVADFDLFSCFLCWFILGGSGTKPSRTAQSMRFSRALGRGRSCRLLFGALARMRAPSQPAETSVHRVCLRVSEHMFPETGRAWSAHSGRTVAARTRDLYSTRFWQNSARIAPETANLGLESLNLCQIWGTPREAER